MRISAFLYDGNSSRRVSVEIDFSDVQKVSVEGEDIALSYAWEAVKISSRLGNTPRIITFDDGVKCESLQNDAIDRVMKERHSVNGVIHSLESRTLYALASLLFLAVAVTYFVLHGNAQLSRYLSHMVPQKIVHEIGTQVFELLDKEYLKPTALEPEVQQRLRAQFERLTEGKEGYSLHFRRGIGANALALPSKSVIITDELIELSDGDDEAIRGVLAHEIGHIEQKHSMRLLIEGSFVYAFISYATGDLSFIVTAIPIFLIQNSYSREVEREADLYAKQRLQKMGLSTRPLAELFEKLEGESKLKMPEYLSSHPLNQERIQMLKGRGEAKSE